MLRVAHCFQRRWSAAECYNCHKFGHLSRDCPHPRQPLAASMPHPPQRFGGHGRPPQPLAIGAPLGLVPPPPFGLGMPIPPPPPVPPPPPPAGESAVPTGPPPLPTEEAPPPPPKQYKAKNAIAEAIAAAKKEKDGREQKEREQREASDELSFRHAMMPRPLPPPMMMGMMGMPPPIHFMPPMGMHPPFGYGRGHGK